MWHDIWHLGAPVAEKVLRSLLVYLVVVVAFRLFGKRELGQANTLDLVVLLLVANAVQNGVIGNDTSVTGAALGAMVLLVANYLLSAATYRLSWLSRVVEGSEAVLIRNGQLQRRALRRELISLPELRSIARRQGFANLADVETATLEINGTVSMFKHGEQPRFHPDESGIRVGKRRRTRA